MYIFGGGIVGQMLNDIIHNDGFLDNDPSKGMLPADGEKDMPVIVSSAEYKEVEAQLKELGYGEIKPAWPFLGYCEPSTLYESYALETCFSCQDQEYDLFLRSVDVIITEKCSLKCQDCSNLMQHYENPKHCDTEQILADVDKLCEEVDYINELRVIGGEPFMNKDYPRIIKHLCKKENVGWVVIYTNGTIVPVFAALDNDKVVVMVTNYGDLSRNLRIIEEGLISLSIAYKIVTPDNWTDCGSIGFQDRSAEGLRDTFKNCCANKTYTLSEGKFYLCPFSANFDRLGYGKSDWLDISRDRIKLIYSTNFLWACDFCSGRPYDAPKIKPAIQKK